MFPVFDAFDSVPTEQARTELQEYLHVREQRQHLFPRALLAGILAALVAGDSLRARVLLLAHQLPVLGVLLPVIFAAYGAAVSAFLARRFAPKASGSELPHMEVTLLFSIRSYPLLSLTALRVRKVCGVYCEANQLTAERLA